EADHDPLGRRRIGPGQELGQDPVVERLDRPGGVVDRLGRRAHGAARRGPRRTRATHGRSACGASRPGRSEARRATRRGWHRRQGRRKGGKGRRPRRAIGRDEIAARTGTGRCPDYARTSLATGRRPAHHLSAMGDLHDELDVPGPRPRAPAPNRPAAPAVDVARAIDSGPPGNASMLELQRLAGNASVSRLVAREPAVPSEPDEETASAGHSPVLDVVGRGGGEPLAPDLRAEMEGRLGADFGSVRVHRDATASESAKAVDAHAYTVGTDVVFRADRWDPASSDGKHTLAHELSHVVQQANGPVDGTPAPGGIRVSSPTDEFEQAADRSADAALAGPSPAGRAADAGAGAATAGPSAQLEAAPGEEELEDEETAQGE